MYEVIGYTVIIISIILVICNVKKKKKRKQKNQKIPDDKYQKKEDFYVEKDKPNTEIDWYLDYIYSKIGHPLDNFNLISEGNRGKKWFDLLTYESHDHGAVSDLVDTILKHYRIDSSRIHTEAIYSESKMGDNDVRGTFKKNAYNTGTIKIVITPDCSEYDTVVAIAMHECAHYLSELKGIALSDRDKNEKLTDFLAMWLGGSNYIIYGYSPKTNIRLGYVDKKDILYANKKINELREKYKARINALYNTLVEKCDSLILKCNEVNKFFDNVDCICETEYLNGQTRYILDIKCIYDELVIVKNALFSLTSYEKSETVLNNHFKQINKLTHTFKEIEKHLFKFICFCDEQKQFSDTIIDYMRKNKELKEQGNPFILFDFLRFYHSLKNGKENAELVFEKIKNIYTPDAFYVLGKCYHQGIYVSVDEKTTNYYWNLAANSGSEDAKKALEGCD